MPEFNEPNKKDLIFALRAEGATIDGKGFNYVEQKNTTRVTVEQAQKFMSFYNNYLAPKGKNAVNSLPAKKQLELADLFIDGLPEEAEK